MKNNQVTKFLILFVFVFLCSCDLFKSMCEAEKPPKQSTTLQQIVNDTNAGETIDLEKYSNEYDITDYNAEISKNLTIKNGSFQNTTLKIKAEVKLEKVQELSVETSANLTIRDSKLNNLLLGTNAESRSTNSDNTNFDLKVIVKNCEIAEKIKINSKAKLNIAGEKTKIAKIVVAIAAEVCKILCTTEVDTKKIENVITDENGKKPEEIKITQAYKITYHSNCDELENIEDFFSPDDGTISLPTDIFKRNGYIFAGWYEDKNCTTPSETSINVSDKTADINVYAKWESTAVNKIAGIYKLLNESATIEIKNDGTFVVTVTISGDIDGYMNGNWKKANEENYEFIFDDNTAGTATSIEEDVIKMVYKNENEGMDIDSYAVKISSEDVDLSGTWIDENSIIVIKEDTFTATLKDGSSKNGNIEKIGNFFKLETFAWGAISASKQALYIDPYGKEITPSVYTKSTTNEESFEDLGGTGVYSYKLNLNDISNAWNGSPNNPNFSIVLLTDAQVKASVNKFNFSSYAYQFYSYGDMGVGNPIMPGNYAVYGKNCYENSEYKYYSGVAATVTDTALEVFVDISQIMKAELKFFNSDTESEANLVTENMPVDLTDYKPYVFALIDGEKDQYNYVMTNETWKADLMKMTAGATFPTDLQQSPPTTGNTNSVTVTDNNNNNTETINFSELSTKLSTLSAGTYTLKVTGAITNNTIADIKNAMRNSESWINLDLSGTTGLTEIDDEAFYNCLFLISIIIPDNITSIGKSAFAFCQHLADFNIPQKVITIEENAFIGCPNLTNFEVDTNNSNFSSSSDNNSILLNKDKTVLIAYPSAKNDVTTIPNSVTTIGDNAFSHCENLTSVTIPNNVTTIGVSAFSYCENLTSVKIPDNVIKIEANAFISCTALNSVTIGNNVTTIGMKAFYNCSNLISVTIPDSVTTIGDYAFYNCSSLEKITIPDSVTSIGYAAFSGCSNLTNFEVDTGNTNYSTSEDGTILFNGDKTKLIVYPSATGDFTIPNSVTSIADEAFRYCSNLTNVTIPDSVTTIGVSAFYYCSSLEKITIPNSVTSIGDSAFSYCSLTSIEIPNSVTTIGTYAFFGCSNLTSVTFADTAGWYYNDDSGNKITINVTDNTGENATYLKKTYYDKYWDKESSTGGTAN